MSRWFMNGRTIQNRLSYSIQIAPSLQSHFKGVLSITLTLKGFSLLYDPRNN